MQRDVRVSVPSFHAVGAILEGTALLATLPALVAAQVRAARPKLATRALPFVLPGTPMELLWRAARSDDPAVRFVGDRVRELARGTASRRVAR